MTSFQGRKGRKYSKPPKREDTAFPVRLRQLWIDQLASLAKRKKSPETSAQVESFFSYLAEANKHSVKALWESYNLQRSKAQYLRVTEAQHAMAYLMAFHPNNIQRNFEILTRVDKQNSLLKALGELSSVHVVDIGAGAGAWSASVIELLSQQPHCPSISLDLIDRSKYLLQSAEHGIKQTYPVKSVKTLQSDLRDQKTSFVLRKILKKCEDNKTPIILGMSYVWNEIGAAKAKESLLQILHQFLTSTSPVIFNFAEPGRESEAREAMDFRQWLRSEDMHLVYPCPHQFDCPMLVAGQDWCYSEVANHDLQEWKWLTEVLKLKRQRLATASYIGLNPAALSLLDSKLKPLPTGRVVGFPEVGERQQTLICTSQGRLRRETYFNPLTLRGEVEIK